MRNTSEKISREIRTNVLCSVIFFFENPTIYELIWKNLVQPQVTI